jgi:hypothetical protein
MNLNAILCATSLLLPVAIGVAARADEAGAVTAKLGESKHTLLDGIAQAEKQAGPAISAKFEVEEGKLMLSVYTAKAGLQTDAEHNTLMELIGEAAAPTWQPKTEVFEDKAHIARSAMQLTIMQTTRLSLADLVRKAAAAKQGTVYSAIPAIKAGKPVVNVLVATPGGQSSSLVLDAAAGRPVS